MVHIRNAGTDPSSLIINQAKCVKKTQNYDPRVQEEVEARGDGIINRKITILIAFNMEHFDALKTLQINQSRLHVTSGTHWSISNDLFDISRYQ